MLRHPLRLWASWAGAAVAAVGACVLLGWILDVEALKTIYGPITMKTNTAIGCLLGGAALWSLSRGFPGAAAVPAAATAAIGAATLSQHLLGWELGIDQALFTEPPGAAATASPNRMGPHASVSFAFAGIAVLLLLGHARERSVRVAQALSFVGLASALVAITGYAYGATELFGIARYTGIALHTAIALFLLHGGILACGARFGAMAMFADEGVAGTLIRRLVLPVVVLPLLLGYITVLASERELIDRGLSLAVFAVSVIIILLATIGHTARVIDRSDRERQRARNEAERANQLKDQFIAMLSHELRTPLNVMLGRLRLLEDEVDRETRVRAARIVARNGLLLARLIEDLLDLSRVTAGQFEIAPVPVQLNTLVRTAVDALAPDAAAKRVEMLFAADPNVGTIVADPQRIHQVMSNLVANAVKFTPSGGRIEVRTSRHDGRVAVSVTDTGIGFDGDFARQLFQPFRQADPSFKRQHGGLGLGLSIARHLAELHGGSIAGSSPGPGGGATFVVTLPVSSARPGTQPLGERSPYAEITT